MMKTTIRGLMARKLRLLTTSLAVLVGVAFMVGTLVFTDTIGQTFDKLFARVGAGTDAQVRSESAFEAEQGLEQRARLDESLVESVLAVEGVSAAEGNVEGYAQIVGIDDKAVGNPAGGAPTFGRNWPVDETMNPFRLTEGRPPEADEEVVIDRFTADQGDLAVGDRTTVITQAGVTEVEVVGIARFGDTDSAGGSTNVMFTLDAAQELVSEAGKIDTIDVRADEGVSEDAVRDAINSEIPAGVEVLTGAEVIDESQDAIAEGLGFFRNFLVAFAAIALFVGVFIIYNTFNILVAQRIQEMALLRALGASRRQVLVSVVLEAVVVGLIAAAAGLVAGVGIAAGLKSLFEAIGIDIPSGSLVVTSTTVAVAFVVGLVVSIVSAVLPAVRASRVPPLAAMRAVAVDRPRSVPRLVAGALITALAAFLFLYGLFGDVENPLYVVGIGALGLVIGIAVLGPLFAGGLSRVLGAPLPRLRGVAGALARLNAARNPSRTSTTASALMIGVALVAFITVVAASFKASFEETLASTIKGDFVVDSGQFSVGGGLSPDLAERLNELPEVDQAAGIRFVPVEIEGEGTIAEAFDPQAAQDILDLRLVEGSFEGLDETGVAIHEDTATEDGLALGDTVGMRFAETGATDFTVRAIYANDELFSNYVIGTAAAEANVPDQFDFQVYINLAEGVGVDEGRAVLETVTDAYPSGKLLDQSEYRKAQTAPIDQILGLVYTLLSFSVFIALIGIANTLALSVLERTRELGVLRAVGMTQPQVRSMVRWESVIIALLGTVLGLALGSFFGWAMVTAVEDEGFNTLRIPAGQLAVIALIAALAGIWAARRPAKRAARLDVLDAIATT